MPILTTTCPDCDQLVPKLTEQTYCEVCNPEDHEAGTTGRLSDVTFIAPHNFLVGGVAYVCPGSRKHLECVPV